MTRGTAQHKVELNWTGLGHTVPYTYTFNDEGDRNIVDDDVGDLHLAGYRDIENRSCLRACVLLVMMMTSPNTGDASVLSVQGALLRGALTGLIVVVVGVVWGPTGKGL